MIKRVARVHKIETHRRKFFQQSFTRTGDGSDWILNLVQLQKILVRSGKRIDRNDTQSASIHSSDQDRERARADVQSAGTPVLRWPSTQQRRQFGWKGRITNTRICDEDGLSRYCPRPELQLVEIIRRSQSTDESIFPQNRRVVCRVTCSLSQVR